MTFGINGFISVGFLFVTLIGGVILITSILNRGKLSDDDVEGIKEGFLIELQSS